jgi:hypothetical protein
LSCSLAAFKLFSFIAKLIVAIEASFTWTTDSLKLYHSLFGRQWLDDFEFTASSTLLCSRYVPAGDSYR